ncbi:SpaA isopeptide-forming pilin-related protein [Bifidobacterium sp. ESL0798]|uniref:SpaA isopeptide-forming pilin-related protein n=1 Tax=Bifidobacterium sp. ESL0798 TaxID=2983235 RepID=UPI0023FA0888|nr:SpaA isopeptide-forming pilin-related protein [Bifidobacterium sp. ESL0798]WEV74885.1 SpaA isopeptide-forming pilin-related protein [Bifidobacterium sp. ESL0798]
MYTYYDPDTYILRVNDQLSAGLTYDSSIFNETVKIGSTTLTSGQYGLSVFNQQSQPVSTVPSSHTTVKGASMVFDLSDYIKGKINIHDFSLAGQQIEITYTVLLNEDAITIDHGDSKNTATVTYKDNPSTDCHGTTTPPVEKHVYTFNFAIKKISKSQGTVLPGTEFQIFQGSSTTPMSMYSDGNGGYRPPQTGEASVNKLVVPANGIIKISGVDAGTYTLKEIKAVTGYIIPSDFKFSVTITPTFNSDQTLNTVNYSAPTGDVYGLVSKDGTDPQLYIVKNIKTVIDLPRTGQAGIMMQIILGLLLVGAGAGIYVVVRKSQRSHVGKNTVPLIAESRE